jgi:cytochrome c biogenesis protein ResB
VTDSQGHELFNDAIPLGLYTAANNPDAPAGILDLPMANAEIRVIAPDNNPSPTKTDTLNVASGEMFVQVRDKNVLTSGAAMPSAIVGQGETANLGGLNVTFVRERQFSLYQVASNPGIPIFWTAAFLLVGGLVVVFYFPHRRVRGIVTSNPESGTSIALFAPLAKRDWSGKRAFELLVEEFNASLGVKAHVRSRDGGEDDAVTDAALQGSA